MRTFTLSQIFNYGHILADCRLANIVGLQHDIDDGNITMQAILVPKALPLAWAHFSGGERHRELCWYAATWLESIGKTWNTRDLDYAGGKADVASSDGTTFAECGYTHSGRILDGCNAKQDILVLPYLGVETVGAEYGFLFRGVSPSGYLAREAEYARSEMRKAFGHQKPSTEKKDV